MNIGSVLKKIGLGALKVADVGAKAGIPIATQIDKVADAVLEIKGKRKVDTENLDAILNSLDELKTAIPEVVSKPKALLESNRFKATIIGIVVAIAAHFGLPQEIADSIGEIVFYAISVYVLGDTLRKSEKSVDAP